jgi:CP family cyanate transporter-like MFS transporter
LVLVILLLIAGLACLMVAPVALAAVATVCLGLGIGALFPLSLIVAMDHADSPSKAGALLAFVQGGGYLIAASMPLLAGIVRDQLSSLHWAWAVMMIGAFVLLGLSTLLRPVNNLRAVQQAS